MRAPVIALFLLLALTSNSRLLDNSASQTLWRQDNAVPINWNQYHDYEDLTRILLELNRTRNHVARVFSVGKSFLGRDIWGVRLTDNSATFAKKEILVVGYHHAREVISAETPLYLVDYLARNFGSNSTITELLRHCIIYVVVAVNVDGLAMFRDNPWQRKSLRPIDDDGDGLQDEDQVMDMDGDGAIGEWTKMVRLGKDEWSLVARGLEGRDVDGDGPDLDVCSDLPGGVDLNRNYDYFWNDSSVESGSSSPASDVYGGASAFSEPETRALRDFTQRHLFEAAVSFHSGASIILYPWSHSKIPSAHDFTFRTIAAKLSRITGYRNLQAGEMYKMSGEWKDWMYGSFGTYAFTIELYGNSQAYNRRTTSYDTAAGIWTGWTTGIFEAFNPPPEKIRDTVSKGTEAVIALAQYPDLHIELMKTIALIYVISSAVLVPVIFLIRSKRRLDIQKKMLCIVSICRDTIIEGASEISNNHQMIWNLTACIHLRFYRPA
ncbi:MAG: M14 family zinc carboxypeptidase [archaeon]